MKINGTNMAQVVSTEERRGVMISFVPSRQAWNRDFPLIRCWLMLSMVMMELSTIIPTPSINPDSEIVLIEIPISWKNNILITTETGILIAMITGDRASCRKNSMATMASKIPCQRLCTRLSIE